MTSPTRRSTLQIQILNSLAHEPATSITTLAMALGRSRPSMSRSLHTLKELGMVRRSGRQWLITEKGREEATLAGTKLQEDTRDVVEIAGRKFRAVARLHDHVSVDAMASEAVRALGLTQFDLASTTLGQMSTFLNGLSGDRQAAAEILGESLTGLMTSGIPDQLNKVMGSPLMDANTMAALAQQSLAISPIEEAISGAFPQWEGLEKMSELASASWIPKFSAIAEPILGAQESFASMLSSLPSSDLAYTYAAIGDQSSLLSSTLTDALHVFGPHGMAESLITNQMITSDLLSVPDHLTNMASSLQGLFKSELETLGSSIIGMNPTPNPAYLLASTQPVAHYAHASRYLFDPDFPDEADDPRDPPEEEFGRSDLDPLLDKLDPDFVAKRRGSWLALNGTNPDRLAHAAGSQKNLLLQLLRLLVPDANLTDTDDEPGSKIKARIKQIMGGSDSEATHVKHVANAVFSGYSIYNKYDHTNQKNELALRAHMRTGEDLLFMILIRLEE